MCQGAQKICEPFEVATESFGCVSASLTACDDDACQGGDVPKILWYKDWLFAVTIIMVFVVDQVSKYVVSQTLNLYESWPSEGLVRITYGTNSGTVWGLFPNATFLLTILSFFAIGLLYYFYRSHALLPVIIYNVA